METIPVTVDERSTSLPVIDQGSINIVDNHVQVPPPAPNPPAPPVTTPPAGTDTGTAPPPPADEPAPPGDTSPTADPQPQPPADPTP